MDRIAAELERNLTAGTTNSSRQYFEELYGALHDRARSVVRTKHHLDPMGATSLVHNAFLRLQQSETLNVQDDHHFIALASLTMRRIVVDRARKICLSKNGGGLTPSELNENVVVLERNPEELIAIDQILTRLALTKPRLAHIGELLIFSSMRISEIAPLLGISTKTIQREVEELESLFREHGYGQPADS